MSIIVNKSPADLVWPDDFINKIICGDCLEVLKTFPDESINCCITSPPYWQLRDYGVEGQLGLEPTFQEYIEKLCLIFDEVKRVLKQDGTCWVNISDTYGTQSGAMRDGYFGAKNTNNQQFIQPKSIHKCLLQIPSRFAIAMTDRGWILRNSIIWHKPNCMPSSVTDRFTVDFEKLFFFVKNRKYWFEPQFEPLKKGSIKRLSQDIENQIGSLRGHGGQKTNGNMKALGNIDIGRNKRTVWSIPTKKFKESHFAVYPEELIITPIKAGCPVGGVVLDPFSGSGTTGLVAKQHSRKFTGIELNMEYVKIAEDRLRQKELF